MEVLVDGWGYMISIDSPKGELEKLRTGTLEGEVLSCVNEEPFNVPTGKKLTLNVDPSINQVSVRYFPPESDWNELERIDVRISPEEYQNIYYGSGRVRGCSPDIYTNILVQDRNAV